MDLVHFESLYRRFPSKKAERRGWQTLARAAEERLLALGHIGTPALIPSFVHARVAAALWASGVPRRAALAAQSVLTLGAHAGLEVRILRDLGASPVVGVERDPKLVAVGQAVGLAAPTELVVADLWEFLAGDSRRWDRILVLAPQALSLSRLVQAARPRLAPAGRLSVLAHADQVADIPPAPRPLPALEGTMWAWVFGPFPA
ncbi:MAG: class I SAM-dependent methyltransferase [Firmicutes bacterium]|nr:class I SAM-dependent methyltransferase [Alicyclobacillaceae bacterium]MCL6496284.1 class I SAM-dependent methyltransferase [Bacillota bacterium]